VAVETVLSARVREFLSTVGAAAHRVASRTLHAAPLTLSTLWLLGALLAYAAHTQGFYPLGEWLVFFWLRAWAAALAFAISSLAVGLQLLRFLRADDDEMAERLTLGLGLGVLIQALGIYVAGVLGILGVPFFVLWPALLLVFGGLALVSEIRLVLTAAGDLGQPFVPRSPVQMLAALLAVAGSIALYLQVVTPGHIGFDARWYHLPIAESYAVSGRIRPFPEGWYLGAYPHLASLLYTWAFLAPGELSHRLALVSHLEFVLLLGTVAGISALAGRLGSGTRLRHGGAALFLFPGIVVHDSNLNGGADHVLAFWAAPLGLALLRYLDWASRGHAVVLGCLLGAAALTKYQAVYFVGAIGLVLAVDLIRRRRAAPVLVVAATAIAVSSPHWLKNWIAYGDPLYPNLFRWLPARPFFDGAGAELERYYWLNGAAPSGSLSQRLKDFVVALFGFSFTPHGWSAAPGGRPVFGSLFSLLLPLIAWVRPRTRVLIIVACVHAGLAIWYLTYRYDRYLQALLPWMAACTAATLAAVWRTRVPALRASVALLVAFQLAWGADLYVLDGSLKALIDHVAAGDAKNFARSPYPGNELTRIGARVNDPRAKLVGHDFYQSLGVGTGVICDNPAWQGAIDYLRLDTPRRVVEMWRGLGATHVLWPFHKEARAPEDLARDAVFARAVLEFTGSSFEVAGYKVAPLIGTGRASTHVTATRIAWLCCNTDRALGLYTPEGLARGTLETPLASEDLTRNPLAALSKANAIWFKPGCADEVAARSLIREHMTVVMRSGAVSLAVRRDGAPRATAHQTAGRSRH
jgi:hypothetical protein